jgi:hypothetical protein
MATPQETPPKTGLVDPRDLVKTEAEQVPSPEPPKAEPATHGPTEPFQADPNTRRTGPGSCPPGGT